ncbi:MAG: cobalamin B12-binding domain-containing protein, partial [Candidatus Omnitrophica bacterium]|nr:cobalamin B12-binding domain-containing protein [Candidatus Omnitrophota bacterium]
MESTMKKLRVLLLNPPTAAVSTMPILNLAYIAAVLRNAGHEVKIIDATAPYKPFTPEQIDRAVIDFKPDFIGVTLTITYIVQTYAYLKQLRKNGIPIVAGG